MRERERERGRQCEGGSVRDGGREEKWLLWKMISAIEGGIIYLV